jgi:hypothetical protein
MAETKKRIIPHYSDEETHDLPYGFKIVVRVEHDDDHGPPWEEEDGHGPVSEWRDADSKRPGERVLVRHHGSARFYDMQEAIRIAKQDGWDAPPYDEGTKGQRAARAVEADFQYLKGWCDDRWYYVGVIVELQDEDGNEIDRDSLWGIESVDENYLNETAREMAAHLLWTHRPRCKCEVIPHEYKLRGHHPNCPFWDAHAGLDSDEEENIPRIVLVERADDSISAPFKAAFGPFDNAGAAHKWISDSRSTMDECKFTIMPLAEAR